MDGSIIVTSGTTIGIDGTNVATIVMTITVIMTITTIITGGITKRFSVWCRADHQVRLMRSASFGRSAFPQP
jgi:hypothetical protein